MLFFHKIKKGCDGGGSKRRLHRSAEYYLRSDVIDVGWMQIKKMTAELSNAGHPQMLKERSSKSACASGKVFELLPPGRLAAERIRYNRFGNKKLRHSKSSNAMYIYMSRVDEHILFASHNLNQRHHTATYIYTHTYRHTDLQTYRHTYIHTFIHT